MDEYEQFYLTRCDAEKSVLKQDGVTIRGSSLTPTEIREAQYESFLHFLAGYDPPIAQADIVSAERNLSNDLPVRLARILTDRGTLLIHAVFRLKAGKRKGNFFSHVILMRDNSLSARLCIKTWGNRIDFGQNGGWVFEDSDQQEHHAGVQLPKWSARKQTEKETFLVTFLSEKTIANELNGSPLNQLPKRLQAADKSKQRRELLKSILALFLSEQRVLLIAESGLAAILLAALTETLPADLVDNITFSTYESRKQLARNSLDFASTLPGELERAPQFSNQIGKQVILIDTTSAVTVEEFELRDGAASYANFTLEEFVNQSNRSDCLKLNIFWAFYDRYKQLHDQPMKVTFLDAWNKWQRIHRSNSLSLTTKEQHEYLNNECLRGLLFDCESAWKLIAKYVVLNPVNWWNDQVKLLNNKQADIFFETISSCLLNECRKHTVSRQCMVHCLDHILLALRTEALKDFVQLPSEHDDFKSSVQKLPTKQRLRFLSHIRQRCPEVRLPYCWLSFKTPRDLTNFITQDRYPDPWKIAAVTFHFETQYSSQSLDASLLEHLHRDKDLLYQAVAAASNQIESAPSIHRMVLNSLASTKDREDFCRMLLRTIPFKEDTTHALSNSLIHCFANLKASPDYWRSFFLDEDEAFLNLLKQGIAQMTPETNDLLLMLVNSIHPRAILPKAILKQNPHRIMLSKIHDLGMFLGKCRPKTNQRINQKEEAFKRTLRDWYVLYKTAHIEKETDRPSSKHLIKSIQNLKYNDGCLFAILMARLSPTETPKTNAHYEEIVSCAHAAINNANTPEIEKLLRNAFELITDRKHLTPKEEIIDGLMEIHYQKIGLKCDPT